MIPPRSPRAPELCSQPRARGLPATVAGARVVVAPEYLEPSSPGTPVVALETYDGCAVLTVGTVARFEIAADGAQVRVVLSPDVHPDLVYGWLYGSVAALALASSGRFAQHATTVDIGGVGVAIGGPSGAGKSTTSLRMVQRGWPLVADDVSPVHVADTGAGPGALVTPFGRPWHVWPATATRLGLDVSAARPCFPGTDKLQLPAPAGSPIALHHVVLLDVGEVDEPELLRLRGGQAVVALARNAYRLDLLRASWQQPLMSWAAAVAVAVPVWALVRPRNGWSVDAVAARVEDLVMAGAQPRRGLAGR